MNKWLRLGFERTRSRSRSLGADRNRLSVEWLEDRTVLSAAFDLVGLSDLRADPRFVAIDGRIVSGPIGVAVIDTGMYAAHDDLRNNFVAWLDAVSNCADSLFDPGSTNLNDAYDPQGHGTHVAGTVGSSDPDLGVAPRAGLIGIRGLLSSGETWPNCNPVLAGLNWVAINRDRYNIRVVNMSLGNHTNYNSLPLPSDMSRAIDRLEELGITVVSAAGNSYAQFHAIGASAPAAFSTLSVINTWEDAGPEVNHSACSGDARDSWCALDLSPTADQIAATSQRSTLLNQVAAPGSAILSTSRNGGVEIKSGTSMASPLVAGMIALMQDAAVTFGGRYLTTQEVLSIARSTADTIFDSPNPNTLRRTFVRDSEGNLIQITQDLRETSLNFRRVNIYRAVQAVHDLVTRTDQAGDTNNTMASSIALPPLDATKEFVFREKIGLDGLVNVGSNDVDLYKLVLEAPGVIHIKTSPVPGGQSFDAMVRLFNSAGSQLLLADDSGGTLYPVLDSSVLSIGTYYLGVSSYANFFYNIATGLGAFNGQSQGDYRLTISLENLDPNGVVQGAVEVELTNPNALNDDLGFAGLGITANYLAGVIDSDPNPIDPALPRIQIGPTDVDIFRVVAPDTGNLIIDINSQSVYGANAVDSYVRVFDESVNQLAFNDDENFAAGILDSLLQVPVRIGQTYYVAVTTYGNRNFDPFDPFNRVSASSQKGNYDLYLSFYNGDVDGTVFSLFNFSDLQTAGTIQGAIGTDSGTGLLSVPDNGGFKDVDFVYYIVPQAGLLEVVATSPDDSMVPALGVWDFNAAGTNIIKIADTDGSEPCFIQQVAANDVRFISVTGAGNVGFNWYALASGSGGDTGNYQLVVRMRSIDDLRGLSNDSISSHTPTRIDLGERVLADISSDNCMFRGATDVDMYVFNPTTSERILVEANVAIEEDADPFLRVFDQIGRELRFNDNVNAQSASSRVVLDVTAGMTYFIGVNGSSRSAHNYDPLTATGAAPGSTGGYSLQILSLPPAPPPPSQIDLLAADDSGRYNDDNITSNRFSTIEITESDVQASVEVWNSGVLLGTASNVGGNRFRFTFQAGHLQPESNMITARAADIWSASANSAPLTIVLDENQPGTPSIPDLDATSDAGISSADNNTNDNTPTLTGMAEPGSRVEILTDVLGPPIAEVTANQNGTWSVTTIALGDGAQAVMARATDLAGNLSTISTPLAINIDTSAPSQPAVPDLISSKDSGVSNSDNVTRFSNPIFTGTAELGTQVSLVSGTVGTIGSTTASISGAWSITIQGSLPEGVHSISALAMDTAGNNSPTSALLQVTIDSTRPDTPNAPVLNSSSDSGESSTDRVTRVNSPTISGRAEPLSTVTIFRNGLNFGTVIANSLGDWNRVLGPITDGPNSIIVTATDRAGNVSTASPTLSIIIDTVAPGPPTMRLDVGGDTGRLNNDLVTSDVTPDFSGSTEPNNTIELIFAGQSFGTARADAAGQWTFTYSVGSPVIGNGAAGFEVRATDVAGNVGQLSGPLVIMFDTMAPVVPSIPDLDAANDSGNSNSDNLTQNLTLRLRGFAEPNNTVTLFDEPIPLGSTISDNSGAWSFTTGILLEGVHRFTAQGLDVAGNMSLDSSPLVVTIDTTMPSPPTSPDLDPTSDTGISSTDDFTSDKTPTLRGTTEPLTRVEVFEGVSSLGSRLADALGNWSITTLALADGDYRFSVRASDAAGNTSGRSTELSIRVDATPPTVILPLEVVATGRNRVGRIVVTFSEDVMPQGLQAAGTFLMTQAGARPKPVALNSVTITGSTATITPTKALSTRNLGRYVLRAGVNDSLSDLLGNVLDGDSDGTSGGNAVLLLSDSAPRIASTIASRLPVDETPIRKDRIHTPLPAASIDLLLEFDDHLKRPNSWSNRWRFGL